MDSGETEQQVHSETDKIVLEERIMTTEMKETLVQTARKLIREKPAKKLTVKDVAEACRVTRQTYYYHFRDIPDLLHWMMEQDLNTAVEKSLKTESREEAMRYFFDFALEYRSLIEMGLNTNYRDEVGSMFIEGIRTYLIKLLEKNGSSQKMSISDMKIALNYHAYAIAGILQEWSEQDTRNMDQVIHQVCQLMAGELIPVPDSASDSLS